MTTDICSVWAYQEIRDSGYVGKRQAQYLHVFSFGKPMTHREATRQAEEAFIIKLPARNGRIAELAEMGFLRKYDTVRDEQTKKTVNRWIFTGRKEPLPKRLVIKDCEHCKGRGNIETFEYVKEL